MLVAVLLVMSQLVSCVQNSKREEMYMTDRKILVAYFSRAGENYAVGNVKEGNTEIVAEIIAGYTGGTLFRIDPVKPYPESYKACTEVARAELNSGARPAVKGDVDVEDYDVIFIGYPNWWGDMPMAVYTFIEKHDWHGKTVLPFCTHEGSGLAGTERKLATVCCGADVREGLTVRGEVAQNSRSKVRLQVSSWLENLEY